MAAKTLIVLVAFPVLVHAVFTATTMLLGSVQPLLVELAGSWAEIVSKAVVGVAFLVAVRLAFGVCRRLWPTPAVKSPARG